MNRVLTAVLSPYKAELRTDEEMSTGAENTVGLGREGDAEEAADFYARAQGAERREPGSAARIGGDVGWTR